MVAAFDPDALGHADARELVIPPVPTKLAVDLRLVAVRFRFRVAVAGGQDAHLVVVLPQRGDGRLPHVLVAAEVMRGIEIANGQDPHVPVPTGLESEAS